MHRRGLNIFLFCICVAVFVFTIGGNGVIFSSEFRISPKIMEMEMNEKSSFPFSMKYKYSPWEKGLSGAWDSLDFNNGDGEAENGVGELRSHSSIISDHTYLRESVKKEWMYYSDTSGINTSDIEEEELSSSSSGFSFSRADSSVLTHNANQDYVIINGAKWYKGSVGSANSPEASETETKQEDSSSNTENKKFSVNPVLPDFIVSGDTVSSLALSASEGKDSSSDAMSQNGATHVKKNPETIINASVSPKESSVPLDLTPAFSADENETSRALESLKEAKAKGFVSIIESSESEFSPETSETEDFSFTEIASSNGTKIKALDIWSILVSALPYIIVIIAAAAFIFLIRKARKKEDSTDTKTWQVDGEVRELKYEIEENKTASSISPDSEVPEGMNKNITQNNSRNNIINSISLFVQNNARFENMFG